MLFERTDEQGHLADLGREVLRGKGAVATISGTAGIGKTSLLTDFLATVEHQARIWRGGCDNLLHANTLGPLREAVRTYHDPLLDDALNSAELEEVLRLLTERLSGSTPTIVAIEDMQWADEATVDVMTYLARRIEQLHCLLIMTYRDDEIDARHPMRRFLGALPPSGTRRLTLQPLSLAAVEEFSGNRGWEARQLHALTGGNPFYLTETVAAAQTDGVPPAVADAIGAQLQRLSPRARDALERISVWPGVLEFDLAETLLGDDLCVMAEAEARGLIQLEPDGIQFANRLARQTIEEAMTGLRRRALRRDVTELLKERDDRERRRTGRPVAVGVEESTVVALPPRAVHPVSPADGNGRAFSFFRAALRHEELLDGSALPEVLEGYALELNAAHRFREAVAHGERAVQLYRSGANRAGEALALVRLSRHQYMSGDPEGALASAVEAVALAGDDRTGTLPVAEALTSVGALLSLSLRHEEAVDVLHRARRSAAASGRRDLEALCLGHLALVDPAPGEGQRIDLLRQALRASPDHGSAEIRARLYTMLVEVLYRHGHLDALESVLAEGLLYLRGRDFGWHTLHLEVHQGLLNLRRGEWDVAEGTFDRVLARLGDQGLMTVYCLAPNARLRARRGEEDAEEQVRLCWTLAVRQGELTALGLAGAALVEWAWLNKRPEVIEEVLAVWEPHAARPTAGPADDEIRRYAARAGIVVDRRQRPLTDPETPWSLGLRGRWREAASRWAEAGDQYEQALELAASEQLDSTEQAWEMLLALGARPAAQYARSQLRSLGVGSVPRGPTRRTQSNPHGLTDRQLEVAELLGDGLTNAEIAARLVVSVRTVDHHVSSVLSKLKVTTRKAAARESRQWGSVGRGTAQQSGAAG